MIGHVILAVIGLACVAGGAHYTLQLYRGNVWWWADESGIHAYTGGHPAHATRVNPNPLWYLGCAVFIGFGLLLVLNQIPAWEGWSSRAFSVYIITVVGLATTSAGVYMIVGSALAWRDRKYFAEGTAEEPVQGSTRGDEGRDVEIDLDLQGKAQEHLTSWLLSLLPRALGAIAIGLILLATGVPALIQVPAVLDGRGDESLAERLTVGPALVLLLILLLVIVGLVAGVIAGTLSLAGWPAWICASLSAAIVLAALLAGVIVDAYPSWSSTEHFARSLFGD